MVAPRKAAPVPLAKAAPKKVTTNPTEANLPTRTESERMTPQDAALLRVDELIIAHSQNAGEAETFRSMLLDFDTPLTL